MARKKQIELTLKKKLEVIKYAEGHGERPTAIKFSISKTTVHNIKKNAHLLKERLKTENPKMKRKCRSTRFLQVNNMTVDWFHRMRKMDARISGPMLQEAALYFAEKLHLPEFKASNGWLDSFKKRHNVSSKLLSGESNEVDTAVVQQFQANIQEFVDGFSAENTFNGDECGLFFKAMPDRTLAIKGDKCKSGKKSKVRVSVLLCASATGEKLRPFVIGKYLKPRCFKNVKMKDLPVTYTANKKAWMTSKLFKDWVSSVNEDMKKQNRSILLIVDNCPAHPEMTELSNLTLKFLPPNTTCELQPMDRGIIKNFKFFYRKLLLKWVVSQSEEQGKSASALANSVTVLDAVKWMGEAWSDVKVDTIVNCFRKAGFNLIETAPEIDSAEEERIMKSRIRVDGVEYVLEDFICCDNDVAITQILDDHELRAAVLEENESPDDYDEEDLIPLAVLRSKLTLNIANRSDGEGINSLDESMSSDDSVNVACDDEVDTPQFEESKVLDVQQVSKMLHDILIFARQGFPEMIAPINICRDLLDRSVSISKN